MSQLVLIRWRNSSDTTFGGARYLTSHSGSYNSKRTQGRSLNSGKQIQAGSLRHFRLCAVALRGAFHHQADSSSRSTRRKLM